MKVTQNKFHNLPNTAVCSLVTIALLHFVKVQNIGRTKQVIDLTE